MIVSKRNRLRLAAVATLSTLALGLAGTALAAGPTTTDPAPTGPSVTAPSVTPQPATPQAATQATITAKPSVTTVQAWELFRVTGTTTGLKAGSTVTLQQKQNGAWVTLPASVPTTSSGAYSLGVKLGITGLNELRIVSGDTASPVFTVTVR
ncbi:hypothetical protein ACFVXH_19625 [Kitasatospora sp. NPDC058184]|uniref:hypothetical protein n=1 Tax=Kitasatospora sp. NPDC058184 TaxID=3346370 RepID=UPI0036D99A35